MNKIKQPRSLIILLSTGLLMTTMPLLLKDYIHLPDFARGGVEGIGIGLELSAFVLMRRNKVCNKNDVSFLP